MGYWRILEVRGDEASLRNSRGKQVKTNEEERKEHRQEKTLLPSARIADDASPPNEGVAVL